MLAFSRAELDIIAEKRGAYFVWCIENATTLAGILHEYRKNFLKRKNISGYKKSPNGTPILIDKIINQFDRKIKGRLIFTDDVKKEYFKGIQSIINEFFDETFQPKISRKDAYIKYMADNYCKFGKNKYLSFTKSFQDFVKSGMANKYKAKSNYLK